MSSAASTGFEKADPLSDPTSGQGANSRAGLSDYPRRVEFAESANDALATKPRPGVDSAYRGKEARQRANAPGRDTEGSASMPDQDTPWRLAQSFGPEYDPEPLKPSVPKHLRRIAPGHYESPDGRYEVVFDFYWLEGECECAVCQGFIFSKCPNDGCGKREGWHIWDKQTSDYASFAHEPQAFDTFGEARQRLLYAYEQGEA